MAERDLIQTSPVTGELDELFKSGYSLVSMVSQREETLFGNYKGSLLMPDSPARATLKDYIRYSEDDGFKAIACSSIKQDFNMALYDYGLRMGILFDARDADILYTAPNLTGTYRLHNEGNMVAAARVESIFYETDYIQKLQASGFKYGKSFRGDRVLHIPGDVSPEKNERGLQAIQAGWREIDKAGFSNYMRMTGEIDRDLPGVTETVVNLNSPNKIKAIVCYWTYSPGTSYEDMRMNGEVLYGLAFKGLLKKEHGIDLPVLFYHRSNPQPVLVEAHLDRSKVDAALEHFCDFQNRRILDFKKDYLREMIGCAFENTREQGARSEVTGIISTRTAHQPPVAGLEP